MMQRGKKNALRFTTVTDNTMQFALKLLLLAVPALRPEAKPQPGADPASKFRWDDFSNIWHSSLIMGSLL